jgi:hypothetical protein
MTVARERVIGIINIAYLATSAIAAFTSLNSKERSGALWWLVLSVGLLILGLFRIAEAGVWLDDYLREGLAVTGLYAHRRLLQITCILAFAVGLAVACRQLPALNTRSALTVAICTVCALAVFAVIRSSSLHWSDEVLGQRLWTVTLSHATQIILLVATLVAAFLDFYSVRRTSRKRADIQ